MVNYWEVVNVSSLKPYTLESTIILSIFIWTHSVWSDHTVNSELIIIFYICLMYIIKYIGKYLIQPNPALCLSAVLIPPPSKPSYKQLETIITKNTILWPFISTNSKLYRIRHFVNFESSFIFMRTIYILGHLTVYYSVLILDIMYYKRAVDM